MLTTARISGPNGESSKIHPKTGAAQFVEVRVTEPGRFATSNGEMKRSGQRQTMKAEPANREPIASLRMAVIHQRRHRRMGCGVMCGGFGRISPIQDSSSPTRYSPSLWFSPEMITHVGSDRMEGFLRFQVGS